jgi:Bacteriophage HK97-gp10, putative tail-component
MARRRLTPKQLEDIFLRVPEVLKEEIIKANMKSAEELAARIRNDVPVETGRLKESVTVTGPGQTTPAYSMNGARTAGPLQTIVSVGDVDVRHGHLVEFGTAHSAAQPFFWFNVRQLYQRMVNRGRRAVTAGLKRAAQ